ncbi:MAG TPA: GNAT family N-acetyltransferase [Syntrophales bacterium]|jgi:ribosomal protein S18 acetylase RimI-like enzyme|nr:GNAT family N-acetyltransferase [Syntrophales bacterium]
MMRILIRQGETRDVEILVKYLQDLFTLEKDFATDAESQRAGLLLLLSNPGEAAVFVAEADGVVVGMATAQIVVSTSVGGYSILLEDMYVSAGFRRQRIGSKLLEQILAWGSERGARRVQLVVASANARAFRFYRHAGLLKSNMTAFYGKLDVMNPDFP